MKPSRLRGVRRLVLYGALTAVLLPVQILAVACGWRLAVTLPVAYHRLCCRILGFSVRVAGTPAAERPVLFVANHVSYLDITVLGAVVPGSFVAKREVADWPFFGLLAKLQRTVFVERRASRAGAQRDAMAERLAAGDSLILFPEGTSSDGNRVLPFKSGLFAAAAHRVDGRSVLVQPVSIAYSRLNGLPMGRDDRPWFAWYGDMDLAPHLWDAVALGVVTVEVVLHEPVRLDAFPSRKALARHCEAAVRQGAAWALAGRAARATTAIGARQALAAPSAGEAGGEAAARGASA